MRTPLIVGLGSVIGGVSSTERALRIALRPADEMGMRVRLFGGEALSRLPHYDPRSSSRTGAEEEFLAALRDASGVMMASARYHGGISGPLENALDLLEDTAADALPYVADLPVGLIVTAYGRRAIASTISALRSVVHALRGWPTPFAAAIDTRQVRFDEQGDADDPEVTDQPRLVGTQVARTPGPHAGVPTTPSLKLEPASSRERRS